MRNYKIKNIIIALMYLGMFPSISYADDFMYKYKEKNGDTIYTDKVPRGKSRVESVSKKTGVVKLLSQEEIEEILYAKKESVENTKDEVLEKDKSILRKYSNIEELNKTRDYEIGQIKRAIATDSNILEGLLLQKSNLEKEQKDKPKDQKLLSELRRIQDNINNVSKNKETNEIMLKQKELLYKEDIERLNSVLGAN